MNFHVSPRLRPVLAAALALPLLAACGAGAESGTGSGSGADKGDGVTVSAAFYPLVFAAERVGGSHVEVRSLTKPGAEPHDLELTPKDVAALRSDDLVVYTKGFQPAVDDAVAAIDGERTFDVATVADLTLEAGDDGHDHASEPAGGHAPDPHFWLDPVRFGAAVTALGKSLAEKDPTHANDYTENAATLVSELTALDDEFRTGLATCASKDLVTGHAAFAYLADRYGLHQEGIAGLSPDAEPNAAQMASIVEHVKEHGVRTIYAETLVSPALAETLARETGAKVAVLDPLEGLTDESAGKDYLEVMRSNLATLRTGQQCS